MRTVLVGERRAVVAYYSGSRRHSERAGTFGLVTDVSDDGVVMLRFDDGRELAYGVESIAPRFDVAKSTGVRS